MRFVICDRFLIRRKRQKLINGERLRRRGSRWVGGEEWVRSEEVGRVGNRIGEEGGEEEVKGKEEEEEVEGKGEEDEGKEEGRRRKILR